VAKARGESQTEDTIDGNAREAERNQKDRRKGCSLYTRSMARSGFYRLGQMAGVQFRKATWIWQSAAGSEADAIQAERSVGRDMAAIVLEDTPRDSDPTTQALLDEISGKLTAVVRNRLHRFQMVCITADRPTAFALPGGFIFLARPLVDLCDRNRDEVAFVLGHEMAHVIRRHAIDRVLKQKVLSAVTRVSPGRGALASWIRQVGLQSLERAYSQDEEFEADELGLLLMRAASFDSAGAIRVLRRLGELDRTPDLLGLGAYLSTHPPIEDRVLRISRVASKRPGA
jgi:predicted Zn-dependent protease